MRYLLVFCAVAVVAMATTPDRVEKNGYGVLLHAGRQTASRRTPPIQQLACVGGCTAATVDKVYCKNIGNDVWQCDAELPTGVSFGDLSVSCEGYGYAGDPFVLKDSCGLKYTLVSHRVPRPDMPPMPPRPDMPPRSGGSPFLAFLFAIAAVSIVVIACCSDLPLRNAPVEGIPLDEPEPEPRRRRGRARRESPVRETHVFHHVPEPRAPPVVILRSTETVRTAPQVPHAPHAPHAPDDTTRTVKAYAESNDR